jgi:tetratricopeptide (TPR) repeat protein
MSQAIPIQDEAIHRDEILGQLEMVLADRRFASSERNAKFLRYVVERTLEGKTDQIKETVLATEVYGRPVGYDPKSDSIVRVEATRLRQKLRNYYENEGRDSAIRIHLPSGTYVPRFERISTPLAELGCVRGLAEESPESARAELLPAAAPEIAVKRQHLAWMSIASAALVFLCLQPAKAHREPPSHSPAVVAWQEGVALLQQDPHAARTERGAPTTVTRAIERLEFAVASNPNFAPAWTTLAEAYNYAFPYVGRDPAEDARRSEAAARRAVALDGRSSEGRHMLALALFMLKWDLPAAEKEYRRALELDPRNMYAAVEYADLLRETGRTAEAAALIRRSRALLPALPQLAAKEAEIHLDLGHSDAAVAAANDALALNRSYTRAEVWLGQAQEHKGAYPIALEHYEHVLAVDPMDRRALPAYGYLLARLGETERAEAVARQLEDMNENVRNCAFQVAVVYVGLRRYDVALNWLEKAWKTHQVHFPFARVEPRFRELHDNPHFKALIARVPVT